MGRRGDRHGRGRGTTVVKAGPEFEALATNPLGEKVYASPAFSDKDIFIRGEKHVFCIGAR